MKRFAFVLLFSLVCSELVSAELHYSDMYDTIDVDAIINSDRLLNQYLNCIFDRGTCTADGRSLKNILPEAIATKCEKCSDRQKQLARKVSNHLKMHRPDAWTEFLEIYDPKKEHIAAYERFLAQKA